MNIERLIADRARALDISGIRRVFQLGARMKDPINLSIGQPDFPVPDAIKRAAIEAIQADRNGYTLTQGIDALQHAIAARLKRDLKWDVERGQAAVCVTAGTSGALMLLALATLSPGDEMVIPDPYFVLYPALATICGARAVRCDTYPDFRMTASRVEPLLTKKTKFVLLCSPSNPCGIVSSRRECEDLLDLCRRKGVLLVSDEIYDEFTFRPFWDAGTKQSPSAARLPGAHEDVFLVRGFGKTYGCTGWRMGYCAGPPGLIHEIAKLQQYSYVCAPSMAQWGCIAALSTDMTDVVARYERRKDMVVERLGPLTEVSAPGGAFYVFPRVPPRLKMTGRQFCDAAIERGVLTIPGGVFSDRDTHLRLSYATDEERLSRGMDILCEMMKK